MKALLQMFWEQKLSPVNCCPKQGATPEHTQNTRATNIITVTTIEEKVTENQEGGKRTMIGQTTKKKKWHSQNLAQLKTFTLFFFIISEIQQKL